MGLRSNSSDKKFTLIEMIVVITIIVILVGIALPAYVYVSRKSKITQTRMRMSSLHTAIAGYKAQYQYFPFFPSEVSTNPDFHVSDHNQLIGTLRGANPRGIEFLTTSAATFGDSWGENIEVTLDLDGDGEIEAAQIYAGVGKLSTDVAIWSKGPDKTHNMTTDDDTNDDNINSWSD